MEALVVVERSARPIPPASTVAAATPTHPIRFGRTQRQRSPVRSARQLADNIGAAKGGGKGDPAAGRVASAGAYLPRSPLGPGAPPAAARRRGAAPARGAAASSPPKEAGSGTADRGSGRVEPESVQSVAVLARRRKIVRLALQEGRNGMPGCPARAGYRASARSSSNGLVGITSHH